MGFVYALCGWRVQSDLPLPQLPEWQGDDRQPDIRISLGTVPAALEGPVQGGPVMQCNAAGQVRMRILNVANYLFSGGDQVIIQPHAPLDAPDIGLFLLGSGLGVLAHQRRLLPLHASCVRYGGRVFAFAGESGVGKSTLAAALLADGGHLLSDDVTVLDLSDPARPLVLPTFPRQKLWQDTLAALSLPQGRPIRSTADLHKFERAVQDRFCAQPLPLDVICHLARSTLPQLPPPQGLSGVMAFSALRSQVYRLRIAGFMGLDTQIFGLIGQMVNRVPQIRLPTRSGLGDFLAQVGPMVRQVGEAYAPAGH